MPSTTETTSPLTASSEKKRLPESRLVFLSGGDPAGIGPEVTRRALIESGAGRSNAIVYLFNGGAAEAERLKSELPGQIHILPTDPDALSVKLDSLAHERPDASSAENRSGRRASDSSENGIWLLDVAGSSRLPGCAEALNAEAGRPGRESGALSFRALNVACHLIKRHGCRALVTAPLSKEWVARSGQVGFSGHTGFLSSFFESRVVMLMHGESFSVIPLTEHVPLRDVHAKLKQLLSGGIGEALEGILTGLVKSPAFQNQGVALCGLNPHCGEGGLIGGEEEDFLIPFVQRLRERGVPIEGPLAADTLFMPGIREKYRLILSCYHDQGLIPFKALEGEKGINVTVGLPFLRSSPDHGTAYNLAGQEKANPVSMRRALDTALHFAPGGSL